MKKIERKFVGEPTSYAPPAMRFIVVAMQKNILQAISGSDIEDAGEEIEDIFGD